jgi:hypothetical protein
MPYVPLQFPPTRKISTPLFKTDVSSRRISWKASHPHSVQAAVMTSFGKLNWICLLFGVALSSATGAFAAQGPGASQGTADHIIQLAMAVLVYDGAALVVGAGLVDAVRRR